MTAMPSVALWSARGRALFPGLLACGVVAAASSFLSQHYGAPEMMFALLLGLAMNFLATEGPCAPGIEFTARTLSRVGIALLGLRITLDEIGGLGWQPVLLALVAVVVTITVSILAARALGYTHLFGLLSGGATAICGGSAALALAAALPAKETGDIATLVKLARVAMLMPVILLTVLLTRSRGAAAQGRRPALLPGFIVAFAVLVALNSAGWLPHALAETGGDVSGACLVAAIAAIGMKTQLREVVNVGLKPIALMLGETIFLAVLVLAMVRWAA